jgi:hypothetical protein
MTKTYNGGFGSIATGSSRAAIPAMSAMMATHMTSFPRSSLLKGGTVPFQEI